jgi:hypothetical protein
LSPTAIPAVGTGNTQISQVTNEGSERMREEPVLALGRFDTAAQACSPINDTLAGCALQSLIFSVKFEVAM